ncbi:MAG: response regulator [Desulfovibrionaceae bacterium]
MRALIAEDEFISRTVLKEFLAPFFELDVVVNGTEAVEAFLLAHDQAAPYALIFMDIMMPEVDGLKALERIRALEQERNLPKTKVIMTTALSDPKTIIKSFHDCGASSYIVKPLEKQKVLEELERLGIIGK